MYNRVLEAKLILESIFKKIKILDYLIKDEVTDIMVNPDNKIFIITTTQGKVFTELYSTPEITKNIINILASLEGVVINEKNPRLSALLPLTKSRFEGLIPPIVENPSFTIRKKNQKIILLEDYVKQNFLSISDKILLEKYVKEKKNILIVGGTNTGKTTFTNALIALMKNERLFFIEEVRELQSQSSDNTHVVVIENIFSPKDAIKSAMRWTPERIIYGEIRGAEAFYLINAFNSGHSGGITTIHANDCYGGLSKLETYILYEKPFPLSELIAKTIDVVVTLSRKNNIRSLESIAEIKGYKDNKYILDFKVRKERN